MIGGGVFNSVSANGSVKTDLGDRPGRYSFIIHSHRILHEHNK